MSARILRAEMVTLFPALQDIEVTHSWTGHLGLSFDALPHLGQCKGLYYALGYSGHGVALSAHLARHVAEWMAGRNCESVFRKIPHPTRFFYRGRPWFRPLLGAALRLLDWVT